MNAEIPTPMRPDDGAATGLKGRRALVVDDSESARAILARILEDAGMEVSTAIDGANAIASFRLAGGDFDVLLVDLVMGAISGIEVIRHVRALPNGDKCAILPCSATSIAETEAQCRAAGATSEIIAKPYRSAQVMSRICLALGVPADKYTRADENPINAMTGEDDGASRTRFLPRVPGWDLGGALERCCGDGTLLRHLLLEFSDTGLSALKGCIVGLRAANLDSVRRLTYRLRGDLVNLGMTAAAAEITNIDQRLAHEDWGNSLGASTQALDVNRRIEEYVSDIEGLQHLISADLKLVLGLPALRSSVWTPDRASGKTQLPEGGFLRLVEAMRRNDPAAFKIVIGAERLLPSHYEEDIEAAFRKLFDSLRFADALHLLDRNDLPAQPQSPPDGKTRILIVDDAPVTIRVVAGILEGIGDMRFALSGEDALETAFEWQPDIILTDINLEGISGIEVCRRVKANPLTAFCVVILISSDNSVSLEIEGLTAGADDFLGKPLNPARMVGRISSQINAIKRRADYSYLTSAAGAVHFSTTGFLICELSGAIIEVNPSLSKLMGKPAAELLGQPLVNLVSEPQRALVESSVSLANSTGRMGPIDCTVSHPDGTELPVRMVARRTPVGGRDVLWVIVDDMREQVSSQRQQLESRLTGALAAVMGGIAHEFNNLLGIVIGNIDLAVENINMPGQEHMLQQASDAALRAAEISRRMTQSAMHSARNDTLPRLLEDIIDDIWPILRNSVPRGATLLRAACPEQQWVQVNGGDLRAALTRLIENAVEAMPDGGQVLLQTRTETADSPDGSVRKIAIVEVLDHGCGMDDLARTRAFEPFFTTKAPPHSGLGLSEVLGFASRCGGIAEVQSAPDQGTVVRIKFPAAAGN